MKKTTFIINKNNTNTSSSFCTPNANYSEILDNIIANNLKATNPYLTTFSENDELDNIINASKSKLILIDGSSYLKDDKFIKAANFLANYKKNKNTIKSKFIFGKTYKLSNGKNITFYDDEFQIGSSIFSYDDLASIKFLSTLPSDIKKTIININIYLNN